METHEGETAELEEAVEMLKRCNPHIDPETIKEIVMQKDEEEEQ